MKEGKTKKTIKNCLLLISLISLLPSSIFLTSCARTGTETAATEQTGTKGYRGDNYKIGVILPLTGKYAIYGDATLHGIECAVGIFSPCDQFIKAELVIKDDAGLPDRAVAAVEELVKNDKVSIIIGPLSSSSIDAAAAKAQELQVPLISLSQREGITNIGDFIFSVAMTADSQVDEIVNWAVNKKKLKNFAIVYPMSTLGKAYRDSFTQSVKNAKAKVVSSNAYGEATLDFSESFKNIDQKFDAVFIPDSYRAVGYISSAILTEGMEGVQLLGINRWNNKELVERGGEMIQGAVFVDGFFEESKSNDVQKFVTAFDGAYQLKPTILEAQGFDAARMAAKALQSTGGAHPVDVRNSLATQPEVDGSTGPVGFGSNREAIKKLFILTVKGDSIVEIEGSGHATPKKDKYGSPVQSAPLGTQSSKY